MSPQGCYSRRHGRFFEDETRHVANLLRHTKRGLVLIRPGRNRPKGPFARRNVLFP